MLNHKSNALAYLISLHRHPRLRGVVVEFSVNVAVK